MDEACDCRSCNSQAPDGTIRYRDVGRLEGTDPKDQTVSGHIPENNICSREDTSDEEDSFRFGSVRWPGENVLELWLVSPNYLIAYWTRLT